MSTTTSPMAPTGEAKNENERFGLTTAQAEAALEKYGFNELPTIVIPLWKVFLLQFTGTMPYMLELACILAIAVQDYVDFAIILLLLCCNAYLGFTEELKAAESLAELTSKMEQKIAVLRDNNAEHLVTRLLVPGDVVLLVGGCAIPADCEWIEGDVLSIDTAALTGEPLPRNYPSDKYGKLILTGCTVKAGEAYAVIRKTGINTEIGGSNADIMQDKAQTHISVFEERILVCVKIIILISLMDVIIVLFVQGYGRDQFSSGETTEVILTCLSIIIASIPIALPLVLQVTMALGAGTMARDFSAVVTSLPALQDIASMSCLCSDKTGTLTTANISIIADIVHVEAGFTPEDLALYGGLASNRDKKEDPIDRSVINHFDSVFGMDKALAAESEYTKVRGVGFNPIYKRVLFEYTHPKKGNITIAKGLPVKVIDTENGGKDDAADQWKVEGAADLLPRADKIDEGFSSKGYKTLGVSIKEGKGPWKFVGILPMFDPPRFDTAQTIQNLIDAGINVKMITGDHLNIAKETARMIKMGQNIHPGESTRDGAQSTAELIHDSDGFAQVLPRDKREVVLTLKNKYDLIVGMTGDGVNDAPALSAAQCGIAVDDATDAAKNAAAIILTSPGLSAIYYGVVESRRIFRKLKSYVVYRFAASIQIVIVLSIYIFASDCPIDSLKVILLALLNDLTLLPIAYDYQQASVAPEGNSVLPILGMAAFLGGVQVVSSLVFAYGLLKAQRLWQDDYDIDVCDGNTRSLLWVQMVCSAELLIFSARAPSYIWDSIGPHPALIVSVSIGIIIVLILASATSYFGGPGKLQVGDMFGTVLYSFIVLFITDFLKVFFIGFLGIKNDVIDDKKLEMQKRNADLEANRESTVLAADPVSTLVGATGEQVTSGSVKVDAALERMSTRQTLSGRVSIANPNPRSSTSMRVSMSHVARAGFSTETAVADTPAIFKNAPGSSVTGRSTLTARDIRPNWPPVSTKKR